MTALITPDRHDATYGTTLDTKVETLPFPGYRPARSTRSTHAARSAHPALRPTARPTLVLIEGGKSPRSQSAAGTSSPSYVARRAVAGLALAGIVGALLWGLLSLGAPPQPAAKPNQPQVTSTRYVVRPGDSLWGIATALHAGGDVRDVVDRLAEVNGSDTVYAGEHLTIPADLLN